MWPNSTKCAFLSRHSKSNVHPLSLLLFIQVVESLALEDTDIKSEHIALIKELIKKEDLEETRQVVKDTTSSS